jgi:hypothetical protein
MDLWLLDQKKDLFRKREEHKPLIGFDKPYLSAIGASTFLANPTHPNIAFAMNSLSRNSSQPIIRHWNGVKRIFRYMWHHRYGPVLPYRC